MESRSPEPRSVCRPWAAAAILIVLAVGLVCVAGPAPAKSMSRAQLRQLCAANCLYLICRHHDVPMPYDDLKLLLAPSDLGVSMLHLKQTAEQLGFETRALKIGPRDLLLFRGPMIVRGVQHGGEGPFGHFIVMVPDASRQGCWIFDPPQASRWAEIHEPGPDDPEIDAQIEVLLLRPRRRAPGTEPSAPAAPSR